MRQQLINTHVVLCMSLEYHRSKKISFLNCSVYLLNTGAKTRQEEPHFVALSAGATSYRNGPPERSSSCLFPPR
jgi:hypothetical protein